MELRVGEIYKVSTKCGRDIGIVEYTGTQTLEDLQFTQNTFNILAWHCFSNRTQITFQKNAKGGSATTHVFMPIAFDHVLKITTSKKRLKRQEYFSEYRRKCGL